MLFEPTSLLPRPRRPLLAVSVAVHLAAAGVLLAVPHHHAKATPGEVAVVFLPAPKLARRPQPAPRPKVSPRPLLAPPPQPAPPQPRKQMAAQRRAIPRAASVADRAPPQPVLREPAPQPKPGPIVLQGLTLQATARASDAVRPPSAAGAIAAERSSGSAPVAGAGRLVDAGEVTEPPAVVARAELRRFYPAQAVKSGFEGDVKLRLLIAQDGTLARVEILRDPGEGLGEAGARAIRSYRFRPGRVNGEPVATLIEFTLHFVLG